MKHVLFNIKVSSVGDDASKSRMESAFLMFLNKQRFIPAPPGTTLGYPKEEEIPKTPINNITCYYDGVCSEPQKFKMETLEVFERFSLKKFRENLKFKDPMVMVPLNNVFYIKESYWSVVEKLSPSLVTTHTTPKGVVAVTKLNYWELESYLDSLIKMYSS